MSASFGHIKRQEKRKASHQADGHRADRIISENLQKYKPLTNNIAEYYRHVDSVFRQEFTTANRYRITRVRLLRFVRGYNQKHTQQLPEPVVPLRIQRAQPVKGLEWLIQGQELSLLVDAAIQYWQQQVDYSPEEILGWTLFSAIIFGGLNDQAALNDFLNALLEDRLIESWQHDQNIVHLSAYDVHYGNQLEKDLLTRAYSFVIDDVTRCWFDPSQNNGQHVPLKIT